MKKLKVGYITSSLSSAGGWDRYSEGVIKSMSKLADVVVLTRRDAKNDNLDGVKIYPVLPKKDNSFNPKIQATVFFKVKKYLKGCDVIHSLIEPFAPGAALAAKLISAKFFLTFHGTYAIPPKGSSPKDFFKRNLMRIMYNLTVISTTGSSKNAKLIEEVMPLGEWRFIPNGYDSELFYYTDSRREPFLLTVGGLKPRKGVDIVIQTLGLLKNEFPSLSYKVIGETESIPSFYNHLKDLIKKNDLESRVEFLGRISDKDLNELYNRCSIFILAAQTRGGAFEGFPMVFYEAQACGAPLISTYGFGSEYVIKNGYNGFLTNENDIKGTAKAIKVILENKEVYQQMIRNSLTEADKHTWDKIAKIIMQMYQDGFAKRVNK